MYSCHTALRSTIQPLAYSRAHGTLLILDAVWYIQCRARAANGSGGGGETTATDSARRARGTCPKGSSSAGGRSRGMEPRMKRGEATAAREPAVAVRSREEQLAERRRVRRRTRNSRLTSAGP